MNINTISLIGITSFLSYIIYQSLKPKVSPFAPQRTGLLVAQDTGKSKVNQSKTGDTSLFIQKVRRKAIRESGTPAKETHTQLGSTTGAIETYLVNE
jgi:hypothetical protein